MKTKQGFELKAVAGLALVFLVAAIVISFGSTIVNDLQEEVTETTTTWIYNESVSSLGNDTGTALAGCRGMWESNWIQTGSYVSNNTESGFGNDTAGGTDAAYNDTDIFIDSDGLATISSYVDIAGWGNDTTLNVTYSCSYVDGTGSYNATLQGQEGLGTFADWLPTLALIVIAAVVIGVIVRYFAFGAA